MNDKITYCVLRRGVRYGVHASNLTKTEARAMLAGVAAIQNDRHVIGPIEREDIINEVEKPTSLDPSPASERALDRFAFLFIATMFMLWLSHDAIADLISRIHL